MSNKLYTEEQVRTIIGKAQMLNWDDEFLFSEDYLISSLTPIELPSDEEISTIALGLYGYKATSIKDILEYKAFKRGAKLMRDKIQGGNNEVPLL
jgi:hypothetical protein